MVRLTDIFRHVGRLGLSLGHLRPFRQNSLLRLLGQSVHPSEPEKLPPYTPHLEAASQAYNTIRGGRTCRQQRRQKYTHSSFEPQARRIDVSGRVVRINKRPSPYSNSFRHSGQGRSSSHNHTRGTKNIRGVQQTRAFPTASYCYCHDPGFQDTLYSMTRFSCGRKLIAQQRMHLQGLEHTYQEILREAEDDRAELHRLRLNGRVDERAARKARRHLAHLEDSLFGHQASILQARGRLRAGTQRLAYLEEKAKSMVDALRDCDLLYSVDINTAELERDLYASYIPTAPQTAGLSSEVGLVVADEEAFDGFEGMDPDFQAHCRKYRDQAIEEWQAAAGAVETHREEYDAYLIRYQEGLDPGFKYSKWSLNWSVEDFVAAYLREHSKLSKHLTWANENLENYLEIGAQAGLELPEWQDHGFYQPGNHGPTLDEDREMVEDAMRDRDRFVQWVQDVPPGTAGGFLENRDREMAGGPLQDHSTGATVIMDNFTLDDLHAEVLRDIPEVEPWDSYSCTDIPLQRTYMDKAWAKVGMPGRPTRWGVGNDDEDELT